MNEPQNLIKTICEASYKPLKEASIAGAESYSCYQIDCGEIQGFDGQGLCLNQCYHTMFDELKSLKGPVLYWFEITPPATTKKILSSFKKYRRYKGSRALPALRQDPFHDTTVLYVGKVKNKIANRIVGHFGFYNVTDTQGLQLFHWCKDLQLSLILHICTFKVEMAPLMGIIEKGFADKRRPLLGKHK